MPVVVFKGLEGWCDRIQVLAHCFEYCSLFNAFLCVDWTDNVWGGGEFDFHDCFEIVDLKQMSKAQVLRLVAGRKMDIRPPCWTPERIALSTHYSYSEDFVGEFMKFEIVKCPGDVLVTNGKGDRYWDLRRITKHLRFKPAVMEGIKERLKDFDPNCVIVHLRGTDRPDSKGNYMEKSIEVLKDCSHLVYVVTDQRDLWEKFHEGVPHSRLVNPNSNILKLEPTNARGTHQMSSEQLKELGIKKWDMMLDLLADWVALVTARKGCGREESTYFQMSRGINRLGEEEWSKMFGGWVPFSKTIAEYNDAQRARAETTGTE